MDDVLGALVEEVDELSLGSDAVCASAPTRAVELLLQELDDTSLTSMLSFLRSLSDVLDSCAGEQESFAQQLLADMSSGKAQKGTFHTILTGWIGRSLDNSQQPAPVGAMNAHAAELRSCAASVRSSVCEALASATRSHRKDCERALALAERAAAERDSLRTAAMVRTLLYRGRLQRFRAEHSGALLESGETSRQASAVLAVEQLQAAAAGCANQVERANAAGRTFISEQAKSHTTSILPICHTAFSSRHHRILHLNLPSRRDGRWLLERGSHSSARPRW